MELMPQLIGNLSEASRLRVIQGLQSGDMRNLADSASGQQEQQQHPNQLQPQPWAP